MDRGGLPRALHHYGGEVHTLHHAGLGGPPIFKVSGVAQGLPESGHEFASGVAGSCWRALNQAATGQYGDPGMVGMRRATTWACILIILVEAMVTCRPPRAGTTSCL